MSNERKVGIWTSDVHAGADAVVVEVGVEELLHIDVAFVLLFLFFVVLLLFSYPPVVVVIQITGKKSEDATPLTRKSRRTEKENHDDDDDEEEEDEDEGMDNTHSSVARVPILILLIVTDVAFDAVKTPPIGKSCWSLMASVNEVPVEVVEPHVEGPARRLGVHDDDNTDDDDANCDLRC